MALIKFKQTHNFNWYTLFWGAALVVVIYLALTWYVEKDYIGIVEKRRHFIGAEEPGKISLMMVDIGDEVESGQLLAMLDVTDLKASLDLLQRELSRIRKLDRANQSRSTIEIRRMELQLENEASQLMDRLSLIESQSTELAGLNAEIERLTKSREAGLGQSRDLSALILQRDALASLLREQSKDLPQQSRKLEEVRKVRNFLNQAHIDSLSKSLFLEQMEYAEEVKRLIVETEYRITMRTLLSPCRGVITDIYARPGDAVQDFDSVLCVEETPARYLNVYLPEKSSLDPKPGMTVKISSKRNRALNTTGVVSFVHPGFVRANERLSFRGELFWARKVRVALDENHKLVPGEVVTARISPRGKNHLSGTGLASAQESPASDNPEGKNPMPGQMSVPQSLRDRTRFEPSGVAFIPQSGKFLIVSDDTGIKDTKSDHAPWIFRMDETGKVETNPVPLSGIRAVNDLEAITAVDSTTFILVSSQNVSKKDKRPGSREMILKIKRAEDGYAVEASFQLLSLILNSCSNEEIQALGLLRAEKDGLPVLNIEGAAYHDGALYLGLKEPVSPDGAIIWKLENVDRVFETQRLSPRQLSVYGTVALEAFKDRQPSISDLAIDSAGRMWALSTIADAGEKNQMGALYRIVPFAGGRLEGKRLLHFPGLKPEGLCLYDENRLLIVFDTDNDVPLFCDLDAEAL